ncbi:helix-turn-helix domain-containing protein [Lysobacter brunescens]|uniref:Helix-turn-helix domain-containing protein n=1 Tax=Lysobacter brunescens TaxID=262323 RepID=A0ABW2YFH9_9GAMM
MDRKGIDEYVIRQEGEALAARLRDERLRLGITQASVADATGLSQGHVNRLEKGRYSPSAEVLFSLARLGYDVHFLVTGQRVAELGRNGYEAQAAADAACTVNLAVGEEDRPAYIAQPVPATPGERMKAERVALGHTASGWAELIGVSRNAVANFEAGRNLPNSAVLIDAAAHGMDVGYVLTGQPSAKTPQETALLQAFRSLAPRERAWVMRDLARRHADALPAGAAPLPARSSSEPPPGHLRLERVPQLGALDAPLFALFPDFIVRAKAGAVPLDAVRWGLMPTAAMEPAIARGAAVALDVSRCTREQVTDGEVYAYTLNGRADIRRILIRKDHWTLAGPGRGGDSRDVYLSDLAGLQILGVVIAVL